MSFIGNLLNKYGQEVVPNLATSYFPDLMDITGQGITQSEGGGDVEVEDEEPKYSDVPVYYQPEVSARERIPEEPLTARSYYILKFPLWHEGERISIDKTVDRLRVKTSGSEPEKIFGIEKFWEKRGAYFIARCSLDDDQE